jgi:hypothetical protein
MDLHSYYRAATSDEVAFYQTVLYPLQDRVFEIASVYQTQLYLTGGTALSRFFYQHRLSEDLDFFTITDDLKAIATDLATRLQQQGFLIQIERLEPYFARFFILEDNCQLKVEFVREFNHVGELAATPEGIYLNNLEDMGANKISAFEDRAEIKDIIDLYFLTQSLSLGQLFELADRKRIPVDYESLLTINSQGIQGNALILVHLDPEALTEFLQRLIARTEAEIKKKVAELADHLRPVIEKLLWDFPRERRTLNAQSIPVLQRRIQRSPLPERLAMEQALAQLQVISS